MTHPNYVLIWLILMGALGLCLFLGTLTLPFIPIVLIFTLSTVKAYLVVSYYMHLKLEPFYVALIVGAGLLTLYCLFFGVFSDIVPVPLEVAH